jgi:hypothetical protein
MLEKVFDLKRTQKQVKRYITRDRVLALLAVASELLGLAAAKKPGLLPFQSLLNVLLRPLEEPEPPNVGAQDALVQEMRDLKKKLVEAVGEEKLRIQGRLDMLVDLLVRV